MEQYEGDTITVLPYAIVHVYIMKSSGTEGHFSIISDETILPLAKNMRDIDRVKNSKENSIIVWKFGTSINIYANFPWNYEEHTRKALQSLAIISPISQKYGRRPIAGERFDLLVTNVSSGPDKDKHTQSPSKLVTMEWLLEENRQIDVEHYILALEKDGQCVELMNIAYPEEVPRKCISEYYLKKLKKDGHLNDMPISA